MHRKIYQAVEKVTAGFTRKWAGLDAACEQKKLEARKMSANAQNPTCRVRAVLGGFPSCDFALEMNQTDKDILCFATALSELQ